MSCSLNVMTSPVFAELPRHGVQFTCLQAAPWRVHPDRREAVSLTLQMSGSSHSLPNAGFCSIYWPSARSPLLLLRGTCELLAQAPSSHQRPLWVQDSGVPARSLWRKGSVTNSTESRNHPTMISEPFVYLISCHPHRWPSFSRAA